ncbi:MAG: acetylglutamate kinase [Armatimonadota bacterium]|nr:MAG: acetylglutamate kinase [Armatimonadota bacterium]
MSLQYTEEQASILVEALPYIRRYYGKTIVIKYGGAAMVDDRLKEGVCQDVVLMHYVGMRPVLVHGGGPEVSEVMRRLGKEPSFVNGLRVTDAETMEIVEMVLAGKTNKSIVGAINRQGGQAVGLSGRDADLIVAYKAEAEVDLGFVGRVRQVNPGILETLAAGGYIPVISTVACGPDGESYNVNADSVAGEMAARLKAEKLILMTDVPGILQDVQDPDSLISAMSADEAMEMVRSGRASRGMIPKIEACVAAVRGGVERAHIIDGRRPRALLMEIFTDTGIGTMITA